VPQGLRSTDLDSLWPSNVKDAREVQNTLRKKVKIIPLEKLPRYIASIDASFVDNMIVAVACLFKYPELEHVEDAVSIKKIEFPYVPGYLTFREGPAVIKAVSRLKIKPELLLFDGQGIAHPAGMGIASHIGALLDIPSIGCAKSLLVGRYKEPGKKKGEFSKLIYNGETVGAVLRTKDNVKPMFVSPGHRTDVETSINLVLNCTGRYRIPEPLRYADITANKIRKMLK
jgi:deoxyribonuclease V